MVDEPTFESSSQKAEVFDIGRARPLLRAAQESRHFKESRRQSVLLQYLVEEEGAGRGERINAYAIALDVFERDSSFNPAIDSIVRVEMHRLRANLRAWNSDRENHGETEIDIQPRSYRPRLIPRTGAAHAASRKWWQSSLNRRLAVLALILIGATVTVFSFRLHRENLCRSARPEIFLPGTVQGMGPAASADLIKRIKAMLHYYPLVVGVTNDRGECPGVPQYDLSLTARDTILNATVTQHDGERIIFNSDVGFAAAAPSQDKDIAAAQLAYLLGHDAGAVPDDALRREWDAAPAAEQYRCLMRAHQYFYASASATNYSGVRECLIREFRQASRADVPAMLAAFELEPRFDPLLGKYQTRNYYQDAIHAASRIDSYEAELLMAQLREIRYDPQNRRGDAQIAISLLSRIYPYEPNVLNQIAITQCKLTQEYSSAFRNIALSRKISQARIELPYAEVFCNLATGNSIANSRYMDKLMNDGSPFILVIALHYADATNSQVQIDNLKQRLSDLTCSNRACLEKAVKEGSINPDIEGRLIDVIERQFAT